MKPAPARIPNALLHEQRRDVFRRQDELDRIDGHRPERGDFAGHYHGSDFGRKRRPGPAAHDNSREQRTQFAREADCHGVHDILERAESSEFGSDLHRQSESRTDRHNGDHRKRIHSDGRHLADDRPPAAAFADDRKQTRRGAQRGPDLDGEPPDIPESVSNAASDIFKNIHSWPSSRDAVQSIETRDL